MVYVLMKKLKINHKIMQLGITKSFNPFFRITNFSVNIHKISNFKFIYQRFYKTSLVT
jgi:hypothetical protein